MGCAQAGKVFINTAVLGSSLHDQEALRNDCFYDPERSFRYPFTTEGTENSEAQSEVEGAENSKAQSGVKGGSEDGSRGNQKRTE
jgi:hypothetical protein